MVKKNLIVSFSGGETSAYMAQWLWNNKRDEYNMVFVFANTGQENEQTLEFVRQCEIHFGFPIVWVEAAVNECRRGTSYKKVDFNTASRNGEPYKSVIAKYGIPNITMPHCTRELKERPINAYAKAIGWVKYYTAIGIREDEFDRINERHRTLRLIYPLVSERPMTKQKINFWWSKQPFRLNLKGYQGNCKWCWKKSDEKLYQIALESEYVFQFPNEMEQLYSYFVPKSRLEKMKKEGKEPKFPFYFFRKNRSTEQIIEESKNWDGIVTDDMQVFDSCEVFTQC